MLPFTDLEGKRDHLWNPVCLKNSLYDFVSAWFVPVDVALIWFHNSTGLAMYV